MTNAILLPFSLAKVLYKVDPQFNGVGGGNGLVQVKSFLQLADPDGWVPFNIVQKDTPQRWLTGADFDIESFVFDAQGDLWVGDELELMFCTSTAPVSF